VFRTVKAGKTTISELAQGFGAVVPVVAQSKIKLDEYLASVAALTTSGLPASQAQTQIRAAIAACNARATWFRVDPCDQCRWHDTDRNGTARRARDTGPRRCRSIARHTR